MFAAPQYSGPKSDHFDGDRFHNRQPTGHPNLWKGIKFGLFGKKGEWQSWTENNSYPAPPDRVADGELRVTFINHATVLIQLDNANILTDPIFSKRCSPLSWIGPRRHRPPGLGIDQLPPLDFILVSHNHYDHLDLPSLKRLHELNPAATILTGLGNDLLLKEEGLDNVAVLDWDQSMSIANNLNVHALTARHFSGRGMTDRDATLWMSFMIESRHGSVYFGADSAYGSHYKDIGNRFGFIRLALLPIGAYEPRWFMKTAHLEPKEAVQAHMDLKESGSTD